MKDYFKVGWIFWAVIVFWVAMAFVGERHTQNLWFVSGAIYGYLVGYLNCQTLKYRQESKRMQEQIKDLRRIRKMMRSNNVTS